MSTKRIFGSILLLALLLALGAAIYRRVLAYTSAEEGRGGRGPVPVEIAAVELGSIRDVREFSGTLESDAEFHVAPRIAGRVVELSVDLADPVERSQLLARLDDDEYRQAVAQAEAELEVARANLGEAVSELEIAERRLERASTLQQRGIASESDLDNARAEHLAREAAVQVAQAQSARAEAALQSARIRLSYTQVSADWKSGSQRRFVSARHVDEGDTVAANTALLTVVELDPIRAVIFVAERDYARLRPGQPVTLRTSAYPGETFTGAVDRVAPAFERDSRQARVEVTVANEDLRLKPGMFVRAAIVMRTASDVRIVPEAALVKRDGKLGVFTLCEQGRTARWIEVAAGIRSGGRVEVELDEDCLRVVTLGQHMLADGVPVTIPELSADDSDGAQSE